MSTIYYHEPADGDRTGKAEDHFRAPGRVLVGESFRADRRRRRGEERLPVFARLVDETGQPALTQPASLLREFDNHHEAHQAIVDQLERDGFGWKVDRTGQTIRVDVHAPDGTRLTTIDVDPPRPDLFDRGRTRPASVNWSAIGSVEPAAAKAFGEAVVAAAEIAAELDAEVAS